MPNILRILAVVELEFDIVTIGKDFHQAAVHFAFDGNTEWERLDCHRCCNCKGEEGGYSELHGGNV